MASEVKLNQQYSQTESQLIEETNDFLTPKTRFCFCFPKPSSSSSSPTWFSRSVQTLKKIREWSEIIAGPKWKTFIRRFNRTKYTQKSNSAKFQYDPLSYALNFDEGQNGNLDDEEFGFRNFSCRYAAAPQTMKVETAA